MIRTVHLRIGEDMLIQILPLQLVPLQTDNHDRTGK